MHAHQVGDGRYQPEIDPHGAHHENPSVAVAAEQRVHTLEGTVASVATRTSRVAGTARAETCARRLAEGHVSRVLRGAHVPCW